MDQAAAQRFDVAGEDAVENVEAGACRRWRDERVEAAAAGEPAELVVEEPDHDEPEPEDQQRAAREGEDAHNVVRDPAAGDRGPYARWHAQHDGDEQGRE